jgi:phosphatidate cytidylyltransferase
MTVPTDPTTYSALVLVVGAIVGLLAAGAFALVRSGGPAAAGSTKPRVVLARAASYAGLAVVLAAAAISGLAGITVLSALIAGIGLVEWSRLTDLPIQHRVALQAASLVIIVAVAVAGPAASEVLVGGLVLVGIAWPIVRADTGRAIRDLGIAAVGCIVLPVLLAHGVALAHRYGDDGVVLFVALAVACAFSDVAAFVIGRRFGSRRLAPTLSPNKTVAGVGGNLLGAAIGLVVFGPVLVGWIGVIGLVLLVPLVAFGAVWGDLLESAVKREFGAKDAGAWLPGFGGILDRVDSLLLVVPLTYWVLRVADAAGAAGTAAAVGTIAS